MASQFESKGIPFVYDGRDRLLLPKGFVPDNDTVIIGRGKRVKEHPANIRFRALVQTNLRAYDQAETKGLKGNILRSVLNQIRNNSANRLGFVRRDPDTGRWCTVDDNSARINIAQAFRDGLHSQYKSSNKRKQQKRLDEIESSPSGSPGSANLQQSIFQSMNRIECKNVDSHPAKKAKMMEDQQGQASMMLPPLDLNLAPFAGSLGRLRGFPDMSTGNTESQIQLNSGDFPIPLALTSREENIRSDSFEAFSRLSCQLGNTMGNLGTSNMVADPFEPLPMAAQGGALSENKNLLPSFLLASDLQKSNAPMQLATNSNKTVANVSITSDGSHNLTNSTSCSTATASYVSKPASYAMKNSTELLNSSISRSLGSCMSDFGPFIDGAGGGMADYVDRGEETPEIISLEFLNAMDFSESDSTCGMKSISSMSDLSDCDERQMSGRLLFENSSPFNDQNTKRKRNSALLLSS